MLRKNCLKMVHLVKSINRLNSHVLLSTKRDSALVEEPTEMSTAGTKEGSLELLSKPMLESALLLSPLKVW